MAQSEPKTIPQISVALRNLFRSGLSAREEDLSKINAWARSNVRQVVSGEVDADAVAEELAVPRHEVYQALHLIANVILRGEPLGSVDPDAYAAALDVSGGDLAAKARILLDSIQVEPSEAEYARQKGIASQSILPTLESVGALCELRAVFQDYPSTNTSKLHREEVGRLLGFEPIVVVGLELNDSSGNDTSPAFQVTEKGLRNMVKTLEDALVQLEVVREYQKKSSVRS